MRGSFCCLQPEAPSRTTDPLFGRCTIPVQIDNRSTRLHTHSTLIRFFESCRLIPGLFLFSSGSCVLWDGYKCIRGLFASAAHRFFAKTMYVLIVQWPLAQNGPSDSANAAALEQVGVRACMFCSVLGALDISGIALGLPYIPQKWFKTYCEQVQGYDTPRLVKESVR